MSIQYSLSKTSKENEFLVKQVNKRFQSQTEVQFVQEGVEVF
jgi:hypothetical protein